MKRYPAFDPPEYRDWTPDPLMMEEFRSRILSDPSRRSVIASLTPQQHLALYQGLVRNRLHDITLKRWVRTGVLSKAWLGTGEEAVTVGAVHAPEGDAVGPMIRNAGAAHEMGMPLADLFRAYLATSDAPRRKRHPRRRSSRVSSLPSAWWARWFRYAPVSRCRLLQHRKASPSPGWRRRHPHHRFPRGHDVRESAFGSSRGFRSGQPDCL
jgi:hypothetical protein